MKPVVLAAGSGRSQPVSLYGESMRIGHGGGKRAGAVGRVSAGVCGAAKKR